MIKSKTFASSHPGKNLLVTGAVHGNEPCGTIAIERIIKELKNGLLELLQGSITFIPICNPEGYSKNKRFIDENLARIFDIYKDPNSYEQKCSSIIAPYIDHCDVILDIHSGNAKNSTFVFQDIESNASKELTSNLGFELVVHGRPDMYPNDGAKDPSSYAHSQGKVGVVIECGQHNDSKAPEIAYNGIKNFLKHYGLIQEGGNKSDSPIKHVIMKKLVYMGKEKVGIFFKQWKNGDPIRKDELIATYSDGEKIYSDIDGYIILPKAFSVPGAEWFYLATKD